MTMTCNISQPGAGSHFFCGNPIMLNVTDGSVAEYKVMVGNATAYTGNGNGDFSVNISDIFKPLFTESSDWEVAGDFIHQPVQTDHRILATVVVTNDKGVRWSNNITVWNGGVSKRVWRKCAREGWNIFTRRFMAMDGNFFMTARSSEYRINMRESELGLLWCIYPCDDNSLHIRERISGQSLVLPGVTNMFYAIDMAAVRAYFYDVLGVLGSVFEVWTDVGVDSGLPQGNLAAIVQIERAAPAKERYLVSFRNSFGCMECIEMVGEAKRSEETVEDDEETGSSFLRYDPVTDSYYDARIRQQTVPVFTITTGVKRPAEREFLKDMLTSDKVFLSVGGEDFEVIPSVENTEYPVVSKEPTTYTVKFKAVEGDDRNGMTTANLRFTRPRLFSYQFNNKFN